MTMAAQSPYQQPMAPWPSLRAYGQQVQLPTLGIRLFFFEAGAPEKPALILIHGLGDEADTWRHVFNPLAEDHHVMAIDLPGFGRSDQPDRDYTPDFMQQAILDLMTVKGLEKAFLMGSSLGAILSQGTAIAHPEKVCGLILAGGALLQPQEMGDSGLRLMAVPLLGEWLYTRLRKDPQAAYDTLRPVYHDLDNLPEPDREFLFTRVNHRVWRDGQRRAYFSTLRKLTPWVKHTQAGLPERLSAISIPTLVIRGEYDGLYSAEAAEALIAAQPAITSITIPGAGHLPQQEAPAAFLSAVRPWLSQQSG